MKYDWRLLEDYQNNVWLYGPDVLLQIGYSNYRNIYLDLDKLPDGWFYLPQIDRVVSLSYQNQSKKFHPNSNLIDVPVTKEILWRLGAALWLESKIPRVFLFTEYDTVYLYKMDRKGTYKFIPVAVGYYRIIDSNKVLMRFKYGILVGKVTTGFRIELMPNTTLIDIEDDEDIDFPEFTRRQIRGKEAIDPNVILVDRDKAEFFRITNELIKVGYQKGCNSIHLFSDNFPSEDAIFKPPCMTDKVVLEPEKKVVKLKLSSVSNFSRVPWNKRTLKCFRDVVKISRKRYAIVCDDGRVIVYKDYKQVDTGRLERIPAIKIGDRYYLTSAESNTNFDWVKV